MPSVTTVDEKIKNLHKELTGVEQRIEKEYNKYIQSVTAGSTDDQLLQKEFVNDYNAKADMYDRLFQEQEAKFQKAGGKRTRGNTIQEYVILIFFVGFLILSISLSIYVGYVLNSPNIGWRVFGMMSVIMFISAGLIISYG